MGWVTAGMRLRETDGAAERQRWQRGRNGEGAWRDSDTIFIINFKLPAAEGPSPGAIRGLERHIKRLHIQLRRMHTSNTSNTRALTETFVQENCAVERGFTPAVSELLSAASVP